MGGRQCGWRTKLRKNEGSGGGGEVVWGLAACPIPSSSPLPYPEAKPISPYCIPPLVGKGIPGTPF